MAESKQQDKQASKQQQGESERRAEREQAISGLRGLVRDTPPEETRRRRERAQMLRMKNRRRGIA